MATKKVSVLCLMSIFVVGCATFSNPVRRKEVNLITGYSDRLCDAIVSKNAHGLITLRFSESDVCENINDGTPVIIPGAHISEVPPPTDEEVVHGLADLTAQLEAKIGSLSNVTCAHTTYLIPENAYTKKWGYFAFDINVELEANGKSAYIVQQGVYLSTHGLRWGNMPEVAVDSTP